MNQWQPVHGAIGIKAGYIENTVAQQVPIGVIGMGNCAVGDIFVLVVKAVIVAHIDNQLAGRGDRGLAALVAEAAQGSVFHRLGIRFARVDFDHPAKAVGLVRFFVDVEPVIVLTPGIPATGYTVAFLAGGILVGGKIRFALAVTCVGPEITVEVLFGHQPGAPGGHAAGTVVERADDGFA